MANRKEKIEGLGRMYMSRLGIVSASLVAVSVASGHLTVLGVRSGMRTMGSRTVLLLPTTQHIESTNSRCHRI